MPQERRPLLPVPFEEAIHWARLRKVVLPEAYYGQLQGAARANAFSIAGLASLDQLQGVLDSLNKALAEGKSQQAWAKEVEDGTVPLDLPAHRLDNIFRTNVQGAYSVGRYQKQQATRATRPYLLYDAVNDSRTRPAHRAMDGVIRPADDPLWDRWYAPSGYRCRCVMRSLTEAQAKARGGPTLAVPEGEPDEGWDYHAGRDPNQGLARAKDRALLNAHPALAVALGHLEEEKAPPPFSGP